MNSGKSTPLTATVSKGGKVSFSYRCSHVIKQVARVCASFHRAKSVIINPSLGCVILLSTPRWCQLSKGKICSYQPNAGTVWFCWAPSGGACCYNGGKEFSKTKMNVFPAAPAAQRAQLCITRVCCGQSLSLRTHFRVGGEQTKNIPRCNLAQTPSGPTAAALRLVHCLSFPVQHPNAFSPLYCPLLWGNQPHIISLLLSLRRAL